jgi:hypothetical protein
MSPNDTAGPRETGRPGLRLQRPGSQLARYCIPTTLSLRNFANVARGSWRLPLAAAAAAA